MKKEHIRNEYIYLMKSTMLLACFFLMLFSCKEETSNTLLEEGVAKAEQKQSDFKLQTYNFSEFESFLSKKDDKVYVVNFWATWCAPCVKELPYFEEVTQKYSDKNVEVLLVSLDFPKQYEKKLIPFVEKRNLQSKVIALNDTKMNEWIPKVDENWTGAIPATIIYNKDQSKFFERSFTFEELEIELQKFITP